MPKNKKPLLSLNDVVLGHCTSFNLDWATPKYATATITVIMTNEASHAAMDIFQAAAAPEESDED